tara:strand:- start:117 stop:470 length:354 start_codon:yes stop_codon:yes gene_type:complete
MLVMRRSDRKKNEIEFHTETTSSKMLALEENARAGIHIWLPKVQLQIQMNIDVEVKVGDITIPNWRDVPTNSRVAYGTIPSPGIVIARVGPLPFKMGNPMGTGTNGLNAPAKTYQPP